MNETPKAIEDMTTDELRAELERVHREAYGLERKVESLLMERARWEREAAAAIRRSEWDKVMTYGAQSARAKARGMVQPVEGVLYRVEQLGERASAKQVTELKGAVQQARHTLRYLTKDSEPAGFDSEAETEARRLRQVITEQGQELHKALATAEAPCRCRGCELIRAMDIDAPSAVAAVNELAKASS